MSIKNWQQLAEEKLKFDKQTEEIHQKFKMDKINKEFGQLSGKELFKPIAKRLDEKSSTTAEEEEVPDYTMDEFDEINPFGDEFRPDAPTPAPSPPTTPTTTPTPSPPTSPTTTTTSKPQTPPPAYQEFVDLPTQSLMEETVMPGTSKDETKKEISNRLRTVRSILAKSGNDPTYEVKSKGSKYHGYTVEQLKAEEYKLETIKAHREHAEKLLKRKQPSLTQLQKTIPEQDWETEGSGITDEAEKLINQLNLSLGSMKAGNSSIKLKNQVLYLLDSLVELGTINKKQKKKLFLII